MMILLSGIILLYPPLAIVLLSAYLICVCSNPFAKIKISKEFVLFIAVAFAVYGYGITCKIGLENDLYRYFDLVDEFSNMNLLKIIKNDKQFLFTRDILFYFIGKTGNNRLLPYIVGFNIYGICGYVLYNYARRNDYTFSSLEYLIILFCVFGIVNPCGLIANVRCVQAYIIIGFSVYREVVQKKKDFITVLLYFIAIGLHITAIIIIFLRLTSVLFRKLKLLLCITTFFFPYFINIAYKYRAYFGTLISTNIAKAYYYLNWTDGYAAEVSASILNRISRLFCLFYLITTIFLIFYHDYKFKKNKLMANKFVVFLYSMMILALGTLVIKTGAYWRFEAVVVLFSPVYLLPLLKSDSQIIKIGTTGTFIASLGMSLVNLLYIVVYLQPKEMLGTSVSVTGVQIVIDFCKGVYAF